MLGKLEILEPFERSEVVPDTSTLEMSAPASKGIPQWVMIVGAVAGVVGLIVLLKNQGGGSPGTVAAGTSINAALGSIQEENMNLLGTTQAGFMQTGQQITGLSGQIESGFSNTNAAMTGGFADTQGMITSGFLNTQGQIGSLGSQIGSWFSNTNGLIGNLQHDIDAQFSASSANTQYYYSNLYQLIANGQAGAAAEAGAQDNLLRSIQQDMNSGLLGQSQAQSLLNTMESQIAGLKALQSSIPNPTAASASTPASSSGGGGGGTHQYVVNLPGGGQMRVNASSPAAALGNVGIAGSSVGSQIH
jgi:hypothetical protein